MTVAELINLLTQFDEHMEVEVMQEGITWTHDNDHAGSYEIEIAEWAPCEGVKISPWNSFGDRLRIYASVEDVEKC